MSNLRASKQQKYKQMKNSENYLKVIQLLKSNHLLTEKSFEGWSFPISIFLF